VPRDGSDAGRGGRSEVLELTTAELPALVDRASTLADAASGWITLQPEAEQSDRPPPAPAGSTALTALFSVTDPRYDIPLCSWVPGRRTRRGVRPDSLGIQHATGRRAVDTLSQLAVDLPGGWQRAQDHPRRGLVVVPDPSCSLEAEFTWLLRAGAALSLRPLSGRWRARIHGSP